MRNRVVVIGLDGGEFSILDELMARGRLPNFKKLIDGGARGDLHTVIPPITPAAWTTFMTGKNPGRHGVLEFLVKDGEGESPVNSKLRRGRSIFRIASDMGRKVVSLSIPITYPPENIDGIMISDFMTPKGARDYCRPPEILEEIERELGPYRLHIKEVYTPGRIEKFFEDVEEEVRYKFGAARFLADRADWDLFALHVHGADRLQHELWHLIDPLHPMNSARESRKYTDRFHNFYDLLDAELGLFLEKLAPDDTVFVISDHGFGPVYRFLNFNVWLAERGYLRIRRNPQALLKRLLFRTGMTPKNAYRFLMKIGLAKLRETIGMTKRARFFGAANKILLSFNDVDWSKTVAYSKGYYGQIFINLKGREKNGVVEPRDYEAARDKLVSELKSITDPDTGKKIIGEIYRPEELYHGPYLKHAPDITFLPGDMTYKAIGMTEFASNRFIEPVYANSGDHRLKGMLIGAGPGIKGGVQVDKAWIGDMAPTILHAMGLPVPDDMDGKVLSGLFSSEWLDSHPVEFAEAPPEEPEEKSGYSDEEKEGVKRRLKDMGYL